LFWQSSKRLFVGNSYFSWAKPFFGEYCRQIKPKCAFLLPPPALKCVLNYFFHTKTNLSLNAQIGCLEFIHESLLFSLWKKNKASLNNDETSLLYIQS